MRRTATAQVSVPSRTGFQLWDTTSLRPSNGSPIRLAAPPPVDRGREISPQLDPINRPPRDAGVGRPPVGRQHIRVARPEQVGDQRPAPATFFTSKSSARSCVPPAAFL